MWYRGALIKNDSSVCVRESQSQRKARVVRIVVRRYKEGVCISYFVLRLNINTEMAK